LVGIVVVTTELVVNVMIGSVSSGVVVVVVDPGVVVSATFERYRTQMNTLDRKLVGCALAEWSGGIAYACGGMGPEIESRLGIGWQ
jgi:hypothetical protein